MGEIITRFEKKGLKLVGAKFVKIPQELAARHYAVHKGKPFYEGLIKYITSSPVVVQVWEGKRVIEIVRRTCGATNPIDADLGTIRADFAESIDANAVHGSDAEETARTEVAYFFPALAIHSR